MVGGSQGLQFSKQLFAIFCFLEAAKAFAVLMIRWGGMEIEINLVFDPDLLGLIAESWNSHGLGMHVGRRGAASSILRWS